VAKRNGYTFRHLETSDIPKYSRDFKEVYNDAWKDFEHFTAVTDATIEETIRKIKPVMDPNLIWFAYTNENEPVAFIMILPDTNELIKGLNGKLDLLGKLRFLWNKMTVKHTRMRAVIMGTKELYRNQGLESALFMKLQEYAHSLGHYRELELSWVGDFNAKMIAVHHAIGATFSKKHATYFITFNDNNSLV
jgi:GNAT superfamily N-acetyltransferase